MAHQREVVGDVAVWAPGLVIAKLNVQAPVQPVFDFPVAAHGAHELLGVRWQAADVVATFNARPVANTARTLKKRLVNKISYTPVLAGVLGLYSTSPTSFCINPLGGSQL